MPISAISQQREASVATNHRISFRVEMGEIIRHECEWAFRYQLFAAGAPCTVYGEATFGCLKGTVV
jgi:hypothetical protein